jgi:hypothetical protein
MVREGLRMTLVRAQSMNGRYTAYFVEMYMYLLLRYLYFMHSDMKEAR